MKTKKEDFHGCRFVGLRDVDYSRVFKSTIHAQKIMHRTKDYISDILKLILLPLLLKEVKYTINVQSGSKILFFKSQWSAGKRFDKMVNTIANCCTAYDLMYYEQEEDVKETLSLNFSRWGICLFYYYPLWFRELKKVPLLDRFYYIRHLVYLLLFENQLRQIEIRKYNLLVLFLDTVLIESYLREIFRQTRITTSTLQHGQFRAARGEETCLADWSIELEDSGVDYFLAWNKFTVDEAKKTNNNITTFLPIGIPSFIGQKSFCWVHPKNKVFGVVLGHPIYNCENIEMIKMANKMAKITGYSYVLKYHPHFKGNEYNSIVDINLYHSNVKKGISMKDYANQVEFSLVGNSSVLIEMAFLGHPIIHYVKDYNKDIYTDTKGLFMVDSNYIPTSDLIDQIESMPIDILFDELCTIADVERSYTEFFQKYE